MPSPPKKPRNTPKPKVLTLTQFQLEIFKKEFPRHSTKAALQVGSKVELTPYQLEIMRRRERNEKARLRIAEKRAAVKALPPDEQDWAARERVYKAKYIKGNRKLLAARAAKKRDRLYIERYGVDSILARDRARYKKRVEREIKQGLRDPDPMSDNDSE
ncbi:hypothetical protein C8R43DRAFT_1138143 [Mycena crocata]|nr:hypothetical protein C8R43DRAFT_1138143 [Mycena crocata]